MAFNPGAAAGAITAATTYAARINNTNATVVNKTIVYSDTVSVSYTHLTLPTN